MSFENFYLTSLFKESNENSSSLEICSAMRNSLARLHTEGLKRLSNTSTNLILEQRLAEYSQVFMDNSEDGSVNSFIGHIDSLVQRKIQTGQNLLWKSKLSSTNFNALDILKKPEISGEHCNLKLNLPCNSDVITNADIRILFDKKEPKIEKSHQRNKPATRTFEQSQYNSKTGNAKSDNSNNKSAEYDGKFSPQSENNIHRTTQFAQPKHVVKSNSLSHQSNIFPKPNNLENSNLQIQQNNAPSKNLPNEEPSTNQNYFRTARTELMIQNKKKYGNSRQNYQVPENNVGIKRSLGTTRSVQSKFVPPLSSGKEENIIESSECETIEDERLKHIDPKMVELIRNEIIDSSAPIGWDDIAGLEFAKTAIQEAVVWPLLRPDIFTGLRRPPKGILLFGPPGTGKTLIGKCIASQCCATFFSISASSLTSKWIGDGEKMVRALFAVARCHQPAVVFIDEIDSLLTQRSDTEHEATRRIKTEFLVQLDGAATGDEDRLLVIGATNRPQELDEAARRRLVKRLYIPLPDVNARQQIVYRLMSTERHSLTEENMISIAHLADGFSGADMRSLCSEAALGPIRAVPLSQITNIQCDQVRPVSLEDFTNALRRVRPSVSGNDLEHYTVWDKLYGSGSNHS